MLTLPVNGMIHSVELYRCGMGRGVL